jgi:alpha-methylacyl-CoA racemase
MMHLANGPFAGVRVVEFASIGPGPHCAMLLADLGADVIRIDRAGGNGWPNPVVDRGRATMKLDIRTEAGRETCLKACSRADVVIEVSARESWNDLAWGRTLYSHAILVWSTAE